MYRIWVVWRLLIAGICLWLWLWLWLWVRLLVSRSLLGRRVIDCLRILGTCLLEPVSTRADEMGKGIIYLVVAVRDTLLTVHLLRGRIMGPAGLRGCRGTAPLWIWRCHWSTTSHHLLLSPRLLLLLSLDGGSASFNQCILNRSNCLSRKHGSWIQ